MKLDQRRANRNDYNSHKSVMPAAHLKAVWQRHMKRHTRLSRQMYLALRRILSLKRTPSETLAERQPDHTYPWVCPWPAAAHLWSYRRSWKAVGHAELLCSCLLFRPFCHQTLTNLIRLIRHGSRPEVVSKIASLSRSALDWLPVPGVAPWPSLEPSEVKAGVAPKL